MRPASTNRQAKNWAHIRNPLSIKVSWFPNDRNEPVESLRVLLWFSACYARSVLPAVR